MDEKRSESRISIKELPADLKTVLFSTGVFDERLGVTVNASRNGMSFEAEDISLKDIEVNQKITIKLMNVHVKLEAKVAYVEKRSNNKIRFGVHFTTHASVDLYFRLLAG